MAKEVGDIDILVNNAGFAMWSPTETFALASFGDRSGLPVLRSMIDRASLARQATLSSEQVEAAMINALKALARLRDPDTLPMIDKLAKEDPNLRVRDAARRASEATRATSLRRLVPADAVLIG